MFKLAFRSIVILVALFATQSFVWSQAAQHHFFVHGWTQGASAMSDLAGNMKSRFGWTEDPTRPDYSNLGQYGIDFQVQTYFHGQLYAAHSDGNYVGLGYSAGGLFARDEMKQNGTSFLTGLVTLNTPNLGIRMASFWHRGAFLFSHTVNEGRMQRGDWSWLSIIQAAILQFFDAVFQVVDIFASIFYSGTVSDMIPNCTFLNSINGTQPNAPRVAVWSNVIFPYEAYYSDDVNGGTKWWAAYNQARESSHSYDQKANDLRSGIRHWWQFWKWPAVLWNRMRAGDWTAVADAMNDEDFNWQTHTAGFGQMSDGFVGVQSQIGIPAVTDVIQSNGSYGHLNHGDAFHDVTGVRNMIELALREAGAR